MPDREKLKRDLKRLSAAIRLDWVDLESKHLSAADRMDIRRHVTFLQNELTSLVLRLDELDEKSIA